MLVKILLLVGNPLGVLVVYAVLFGLAYAMQRLALRWLDRRGAM
jgi:hypothetical protein